MTALEQVVSSASPHVALHEGKPTTTSQDVAQTFGKAHQGVLRAIRELIRLLDGELMITPVTGRAQTSPACNFAPGSYLDPQGQKRPMYWMTRDGFTLLAMGFTGKEALRFKLAYIDAFNRMEEELRRQQGPPNAAQLLEDRLRNGRFLITTEHNSLKLTEVSGGSVVFDPTDAVQMVHLMRTVPQKTAEAMLHAGVDRLAAAADYVAIQAAKRGGR